MATNQEKQHVANYKIRLVYFNDHPAVGDYFISSAPYWYEGALEATERYARQLAKEEGKVGASIYLNDKQVSYFLCDFV